MELRQLSIFRILAHELSFTRAALKANCVQSNVTVQIRSMERELGVPLFERLGKRVCLTECGRRLLPYADKILQLAEEAGNVAYSEQLPAGLLRIGSPESVLTYRLPPVLQSFRSVYPDVNMVFHSGRTADLAESLGAGELDLALVIDDLFVDPRLEIEVLCSEPLSLLVSPEHPLALRPRFQPTALKEHTFLLTDPGCAYRSKLERALARAGTAPETVMEFSSVETIKQCAALGMGVACLPSLVAVKEVEDGTLVPLFWLGARLAMKTLVVWHKDKWHSPGMRCFLSVLRARLHTPQVSRSAKLQQV